MMISSTVKGNLRFPKLTLIEDLRIIASRIFIPTMQKNIDEQIDINGNSLPPLELSTIRRKIAKGLSVKTLIETGALRVSFLSKDRGKNSVVVTLGSNRKKIGGYLQIDGIKSKHGIKYFNFFGISSSMERDAMNYMRDKIKRAISNA